MKVKIEPGWSSSGEDYHIEDGYMVLDEVVKKVYLDGEEYHTDFDRFVTVERVEDDSPEAIHLFTED